MEDIQQKINAKGDGTRNSSKHNAQEFNGIANSLKNILTGVGVPFSGLDSQGNVINTDLLAQAIYKMQNVNNFFIQGNANNNNIVLNPSVATAKYTNQFFAGYIFKFVATKDYIVGQNVLILPQPAKQLVDKHGKAITNIAWKVGHVVELMFDGAKYRLLSDSYYNEIKQAEAEVGTLVYRFDNVSKIGRKILRGFFGGTIDLAFFPLFKKWLLAQLEAQPNNTGLQARYNESANTFDFWDAVGTYPRHFTLGSGMLGDFGDQSLPALTKGDLDVSDYNGADRTTNEYKGGFYIQIEGDGTPIVKGRGGAVLSRNHSEFKQYNTAGVGSKFNTDAIDFNHTHTVNINHGHEMTGDPAYDRAIAVGNVEPKHLNVYASIVVDVDYD